MNWVPGFNHDPCELKEARTREPAVLPGVHHPLTASIAGGLFPGKYISRRQDPQWRRLASLLSGRLAPPCLPLFRSTTCSGAMMVVTMVTFMNLHV